MKTLKVKPEQYELIKKLYYEDMKSQLEISKIIGVSQNCIFKLFKRMDWPKRNRKEAAKVKKYSSGLEEWREENGSWNKGLTKENPKMKDLIDKGRITQIKNGKSKGSNNPMYGKVSNSKSGYRKDLGHFVRSSWEANFARILNFINLPYEYEKYTFTLKNRETYTPDFYIPTKDMFYEIKGWENTDKHYRFKKEFPDKKLSIILEKKYNRIINKFSNNIEISDSNTTYTKSEIVELFLKWVENNDKTISCHHFQKSIGINTKTIQRLFGSQKKLIQAYSEQIQEIEISRCCLHFNNLKLKGLPLHRRSFYKFYKRAATIISKYFKCFGNFLIFVNNLLK
jgi:hypothetical protein